MSYCTFVRSYSGKYAALHHQYHDEVYGFPVDSDNELYGRLVLEIHQAGLNWGIILAKQQAFREAFAQFDITRAAAFGPEQVAQLLNNPDIIRNRLKIEACIHNARQIRRLQAQYGSFAAWLTAQTPQPLEDWTRSFRQQFKFTGPKITEEFLLSSGFLPGAHDRDCPIYQRVLAASPPWVKHSPPAARAQAAAPGA